MIYKFLLSSTRNREFGPIPIRQMRSQAEVRTSTSNGLFSQTAEDVFSCVEAQMSLNTRHPDVVACEQQKCRPASASAQSDLDGDVPCSASFGVYIQQLIRFAKVCSNVADSNNRNLFSTAKILKQC